MSDDEGALDPLSPSASWLEEESAASGDEEDEEGEEQEEEALDVDGFPQPVAGESHGRANIFVSDVLLPLELAALEGREARRIDAGADLVHGDTRGSSNALDLARMYIGEPDGRRRPPFIVVRELPDGSVHRLSLRDARIARPVLDALPSP